MTAEKVHWYYKLKVLGKKTKCITLWIRLILGGFVNADFLIISIQVHAKKPSVWPIVRSGKTSAPELQRLCIRIPSEVCLVGFYHKTWQVHQPFGGRALFGLSFYRQVYLIAASTHTRWYMMVKNINYNRTKSFLGIA